MFTPVLKRATVVAIIVVTLFTFMTGAFNTISAGGGLLDSLSFPNATGQNCGYWQATGSLSTTASVSYTMFDGYGAILSQGSVPSVQRLLVGGFWARPLSNPFHLVTYSGSSLVADLYADNPCIVMPVILTPTSTMTFVAQPTALLPVICTNAPRPRLLIGMFARVIPGLPHVLRDRPGLRRDGSRMISYIPAGSQISVLEGPICVSGYLWWKINYNSVLGWTAEGAGNVYWLEPLV